MEALGTDIMGYSIGYPLAIHKGFWKNFGFLEIQGLDYSNFSVRFSVICCAGSLSQVDIIGFTFDLRFFEPFLRVSQCCAVWLGVGFWFGLRIGVSQAYGLCGM